MRMYEELKKINDLWKKFLRGEASERTLINKIHLLNNLPKKEREHRELVNELEEISPVLKYLALKENYLTDGKVKGKPAKLINCSDIQGMLSSGISALIELCENKCYVRDLFSMVVNDVKNAGMALVHAVNEAVKTRLIETKEKIRKGKILSSQIAKTCIELKEEKKKGNYPQVYRLCRKLEDRFKEFSSNDFSFPDVYIGFSRKEMSQKHKALKALEKRIRERKENLQESECVAVISGGIETAAYLAMWLDKTFFWSVEYSRKRLKQTSPPEFSEADTGFFEEDKNFCMGEDWISSGQTGLGLKERIHQYNRDAEIYIAALKAKEEGIKLLESNGAKVIYGIML